MPIPSVRDLEGLSLDELDELVANIAAARGAMLERARGEAMREIQEIARKYRLPLEQIVAELEGRSRSPAVVGKGRYQHPTDPDLSWSGMGRKPAWLKELLMTGIEIESLLRT